MIMVRNADDAPEYSVPASLGDTVPSLHSLLRKQILSETSAMDEELSTRSGRGPASNPPAANSRGYESDDIFGDSGIGGEEEDSVKEFSDQDATHGEVRSSTASPTPSCRQKSPDDREKR